MARLAERLATARRALRTLQELPLGEDTSALVRDAAIQRFEYTFEAVWKAAQLYLVEVEGLEIGSPKGVIRGFLQVGLLSEEETRAALAMVDDRNLTVHTYNESLAQRIYANLPGEAELLDRWLAAMEGRAQLGPV